MTEPLSLLDPDVRAVVAAQRLCFAATVSPAGEPNLSPKGTIRIEDDQHLWFLDIASPATVRNLRANPAIELNVVDPISRRGYRFRGTAMLHPPGDPVFEGAVERIAREEGVRYHADTVVRVRVRETRPLWSPGYDHLPDEAAMRALWAARRAALDAGFEAHLARHGGFVVPPGDAPGEPAARSPRR